MDGRYLTSDQWCKELNINIDDILDPDGWDRTDFERTFYHCRLNLEQFKGKLMISTCRLTDEILKVCNGLSKEEKIERKD